MDSCQSIPRRDATSAVLRQVLFCAIAWTTTVQIGAQMKPPGPVSQAASDVKSCALIRAVNPKLPPQAPSKKKLGPIVLHAAVAADGVVEDVTVVSGDPALVGPAMDAARQYRYAPCIQNGVPVESQTTITVMYDPRRAAAYPAEAPSTLTEEPQENVTQEIENRQLFQLRDGVTFPKVLYKTDPEYSKDARKDKLEGYVELGLVVGPDGKPRSLWVVRPLGEGLDENAIDAVKRWIFTPATKEGKPVPILINLAIGFRR
jgi:TonB family protein